jgi:glycosyltransferase involved in cell wall biosynthesis
MRKSATLATSMPAGPSDRGERANPMTRALRILHIISGDLWAGAEVQACTLIAGLVRIPDTEVAAVVMNEGRLADELRAVGIRVVVMNEEKLGPLQIGLLLRRLLKSWRPDVIHTHREKENILGMLANRACGNVPLVRTMHGGDEHTGAAGWRRIRHALVMKLDRWCGRASQHRVIAVSRDLGIRLARDFPADRIVLIENGVDAEAIRATRGVAEFRTADPNSMHIGIVGRLVPVKRVDIYLQTAAHLRCKCPEVSWRFHVFGDGLGRSDLEALSERLQISDVTTFHGYRPDIATCIGGLDALVICSDHEGMPMTALEAAALEVPTIAHAVGGLVDVAPQAFLVARHDAEGYGEAILRAIGAEGRSIARARAAEALLRFSAKGNAERVRALYQQLVCAEA